MATTIHLYDPGMKPKTEEFPTEEEALASFDAKRAHYPYTDALIKTDSRVTHVGKRELGENTWSVRARFTN